MHIRYQLLLVSLIAPNLEGACFPSQENALKKYDQLVEQLASAQSEGEYVGAADLIIEHTNQLRTSFGSKNLAEMRRECDAAFTTRMTEIAQKFIAGPLLPKNADPNIRKKALNLLQKLLATRIITLDSPQDAIGVARALLDIGLWEALEITYNQMVFVPKITTQDDQKALFEAVFLPLVVQYGPQLAVKSPAVPGYDEFTRVIQTLLDYHKQLTTLKDSAGKTVIHRLFEKDLSGSIVQPQKVKSDKYLRELTSLKPLAGLKKVSLFRSLPANAQAADWILFLGHAIGTIRDAENNTIFHALRKNNRVGAQDADVRYLLEQAFGTPDFATGFSLAQFANIVNADGKRYTDYPPLVDPSLYQDYLGVYTAHALNQLAESLNTLI